MDGWIDGSRTAWRRYGRTSERRILTVTRVVVRWKLETILAWAVIASKSIDATLVAASIDIIALVYICEDKFYMMRTSYEIKSILINRVLTIVPFSFKKKKKHWKLLGLFISWGKITFFQFSQSLGLHSFEFMKTGNTHIWKKSRRWCLFPLLVITKRSITVQWTLTPLANFSRLCWLPDLPSHLCLSLFSANPLPHLHS